MKKIFTILFIAFITFLNPFYPQTYVSGVITSNTTWYASNDVYIVLDGITVPDSVTLTIQAGVIVKFTYTLRPWETGMAIYGILDVQGTANDRVVFTSLSDDSYGGDTNGDGISAPNKGSWGGVTIYNSNNVIENCLFRYGGSYAGLLEIENCNPTVRNCTFEESLQQGIVATGLLDNLVLESDTVRNCAYDGINMSSTSGDLNIRDNIIYNCVENGILLYSSNNNFSCNVTNNEIRQCGKGGIYIGRFSSSSVVSGNTLFENQYGITTDNLIGTNISNNIITLNSGSRYPFFQRNTAFPSYSGNTIINGIKKIAVQGEINGAKISQSNFKGTWGQIQGEEYKYVIVDGIKILTDDTYGITTLSIPAGTVIKFTYTLYPWSAGINVYGKLDLQGTANNPVVFTSIADDSYGGDTNGDGISTPNRGSWGGVTIYNSNNVIENCLFRYGGYVVQNQYAILQIKNCNAIVKNCTIEESGGNGIYVTGTLDDFVLESDTVRNCSRAGIGLYATGNFIIVKNNNIYNVAEQGIIINGTGQSGFILNNKITQCGQSGISINESNFSVNNNDIIANVGYGLLNQGANLINAENNYWGDPSGPYHPTLNASGQGNAVSDNVDFVPFSTIPISNVTATLNAVWSYLTNGPAENQIAVPTYGKGYIYYYLTSNEVPINDNNYLLIPIIRSDNQQFLAEGLFLKEGILRITIADNIVINNEATFQINDSINIGNILFILENDPPSFTAIKYPKDYSRSFFGLFEGSAGLSGTVGSIGAGVSVSAVKLSVKGVGGIALKITENQNGQVIFDRRFDWGIGASLKIPSINTGVRIGESEVLQFGIHSDIILRKIQGQSFSFSDLSLDDNLKKMAQSGFLLENLSIGLGNISPTLSIFMKAIIFTINSLSNVDQTFKFSKIHDYWGTGFEGSIGVGLSLNVGPVKLTAFDASGSATELFKDILYDRNFDTHILGSSIRDHTFGCSYNLSVLSLGFKFDDKTKIGTSTGLIDIGSGQETSYGVEFDNQNDVKKLYFSLTGEDKASAFFGFNKKSYYYHTLFEIPGEYANILKEKRLGIAGLYSPDIPLPMGIKTSQQTEAILKTFYDNYGKSPIEVKSIERVGKGIDSKINIDLDAAFGVGLGLTLGYKLQYLDETEYIKKYSKIYANGENYLIYSVDTLDYSNQKSFTEFFTDLLSGTAPLIREAFLNLLKIFNQIVQAGQNYSIGTYNDLNNFVGNVSGTMLQSGEWKISTFSPNSLRLYSKPFHDPIIKNMYYSKSVIHKNHNRNISQSLESNSFLIIVSDAMKLSFIPDGQTSTIDSVDTLVTIKMVIDEKKLLEYGFTLAEKERVKIYRYDDSTAAWIYEGGTLVNDTLMINDNKLSTYALGIEIFDTDDSIAPEIYNFGPKQDSILVGYPEVFMKVRDNRYGVGIDYNNTFMIINGDTVNYSFNPAEEKISYQLSDADSLTSSNVSVKVIASDYNGNSSIKEFDFTFTKTSVRDVNSIPTEYILYECYPNPWNSSTIISFSLPENSILKIQIFNSIGELVGTIYEGEQSTGLHNIAIEGNKLASGIYYISLTAKSTNSEKDFRAVRKMVLLK